MVIRPTSLTHSRVELNGETSERHSETKVRVIDFTLA
jgi:hypothetical protein